MIASTITIGFGGSVGTEATIVLTGASIGSNMARFFHMNYKVMTLMIGCGAAGAIAGIFKAPIAGIVFTLEVLMLDLTMASLVPLMIAAISSYVIVYFLMPWLMCRIILFWGYCVDWFLYILSGRISESRNLLPG